MNNLPFNFLFSLIFCTATISFASDSSCESDEDCSQPEIPIIEKTNDYLYNFPDPYSFLPVEKLGISSKEDFINYWKTCTGKTIVRLSSFNKDQHKDLKLPEQSHMYKLYGQSSREDFILKLEKEGSNLEASACQPEAHQ